MAYLGDDHSSADGLVLPAGEAVAVAVRCSASSTGTRPMVAEVGNVNP